MIHNSTNSISIIIPTFNREGLIERAIRSILNQSHPFFEIIIVDDCSEDQTVGIISNIKDHRIRVISNEKNRGACYCRNKGIKESRYDLIAFLDSDDEWLPTFLEIQLEKADSPLTKNYFLQFCQFELIGPNNHMVVPNFTKLTCNKFEIQTRILKGNFISTQTILTNKKTLLKAGGFNERLPAFQDMDLVLRINRFADIKFIPVVLVKVYHTKVSISTNHEKRFLALGIMWRSYHDAKLFNTPEQESQFKLYILHYKYHHNIRNPLPYDVKNLRDEKLPALSKLLGILKYLHNQYSLSRSKKKV